MRLAIVVPCYNEEGVIGESARQLTCILKELIDKDKISENSFILFVNDGSKDNTWPMIEELYKNDKHIFGLSLALNRGHQNALLAGLMTVKDICDAAVSMSPPSKAWSTLLHKGSILSTACGVPARPILFSSVQRL